MEGKKLRIFKEYTLMEILKKILNKIVKKIKVLILKCLFLKLDYGKIKKDFKRYSPKIIFFYSVNNKGITKEFYKINSGISIQIIENADQIIKHKFDLLGSGIKKLDKKIKWNEDFKTGFIWENKFYKDIKVIDLDNNADVKIPWELSRFQHLFCLGKAYWITDDKKYYMEFKEEILGWIDKNPYCMSVNWTCAMDVAIRSINWIFAYYHFEDLIDKDLKFKNQFNKSLYQHGKFIFRNLENNSKLKNNHYLSDLVGLVYLGLYFKDLSNRLKEHKKWLKFGIKELKEEMFAQNNPDGTNYETSTSYHRLVTELFLYMTLLAEKNGIIFSKEYKKKLEKMHEFLMDITKPNGLSPLIGDVDDGRLLILSDYYNWDKRELNNTLGIAGTYFDRDDFRIFGKKFLEENIWISREKYLKERQQSSLKSKAYEDGGYYILKNNSIYCIIRCGELSLKGQGGHSHNDQLSIELNIRGKDFFIDPGVDVYTGDYKSRNKFRSTVMHNTVSIDDYEQNGFEEKELFRMKEQTFAKCLKFSDTEFEGEHYGYQSKLGIVHNRKINIKNNVLEIEDNIEKLKGEVNFILDENIEIINAENDKILLRNGSIFLKISNIKNYVIKDEIRAVGYGNIIETKKIKIKFMSKNKIEVQVLDKRLGDLN